ncbi:MAG: hypothetical protein JNM82_00600 [Rhodocyclaceae bacterium]|nr:hypothetical protein [Rhodocyclaceae bacterium]
MAMGATPLILSAQMTRRIEKLARDAGRTPETMLRFVLRDGIEYCEYTVKAVNEGLADVEAGRVLSAPEVAAAVAKRRAARRGRQAA